MISGNSGGWKNDRFLDLSPLTGLTSVWIAFQFTSDETNVDMPFDPEGAFIDDISIKARISETDPWEIVMTEDFESEFPPILEVTTSFLPSILSEGSRRSDQIGYVP